MTHAKIYVPKSLNEDLHIDVKKTLSDLFGGFTMYFTHGGWVNSSGELVEEKVLVYETYTDIIYSDVKKDMDSLAGYVMDMSDEDTVMYTVNHDSFFK